MIDSPMFPSSAPAKISAPIEPSVARSAAGAAAFKGSATLDDWTDDRVDAAERGNLLLDILRERGDEQAEMTSRPLASVLPLDHAILLSGKGSWLAAFAGDLGNGKFDGANLIANFDTPAPRRRSALASRLGRRPGPSRPATTAERQNFRRIDFSGVVT